MHFRHLLTPALLGAPMLLGAAPAAAQTSSADGIWSRANLLGDMGGLRTVLGDHGVTLDFNDSENLLGNVSGGVKRGATLQGVTTGTMEVDTGKAFGLPGGTFHVSALQVHGQQLSEAYLDNLQTANGNEAEDGTRLWELWYDQAFFNGKADIKLGEQSIDNEFIVSQNSNLFVNTMAGWPMIPSVDLYGGAPAYPLSSLGVRLQVKPADNQAILAGVFDDNPGGGGFSDDAQMLDNHGTNFNLNTGALWIAEYQYSLPGNFLPGTYKLGGWYDSGHYPDQRYGTDGLSLANPASNGNAIMHRGNYGIYIVADQTIWKSQANSARTLNLFGRVMGAPDTQNEIDFSFNGGLTLTAPLPGRDNDQAGIDFGLARVGSRAAALDRDSGLPVRGTEELLEFTYQAQVLPWLMVQPDIQYIISPGGGIQDPNNPNHKLRNELVVGVREVTTF